MQPEEIAQTLIRIPSITPAPKKIFRALESILQPLGFQSIWIPCHNIYNVIYIRDTGPGPHFTFSGHLDTVPAPNEHQWQYNPFHAIIKNGTLFGRGAADMKSAIASFICAIPDQFQGKISLMITGDEEGEALFGTKYIMEILHQKHITIDACLVGEPTSNNHIGDTVKVGRRGSLHGTLTAHGTWGHTGYITSKTQNAAENLAQLIVALSNIKFDNGNNHFEPTTCVISNISTPNTASNVIPGEAVAYFNIRFNTEQTIETLRSRIISSLPQEFSYTLQLKPTASEPFLSINSPFLDLVLHAVQNITNQIPHCSTQGGTSDARFIHKSCPVVELGLKNHTIHQTNEHTTIEDLQQLTAIYRSILKQFFH